MLNIDVFLPRLIPSVPGCPDPLARQALIDAAIEFCEETMAVQHTTDPQYAAGGSVYEVDVPTGQRVVCTLRAWYGTTELSPCPSSQISNVDVYGASCAPCNPNTTPHSFLEAAPGEVRIYPTPGIAVSGLVTFRVATKPTRSATKVEDVLFDDWAEVVVAGALRRLHAIQDTPFFSDAHAARRGAEFLLGVTRGRAEAQRGRVRGSLSVTPRAFI